VKCGRLARAAAFALLGGSLAAAGDGVELRAIDQGALAAVRRNATGKLRLISVWATWCAPCHVELPEIFAVDRDFRGERFETLTVSADESDTHQKALSVLRRLGASTTNYRFGGDMPALAKALDASWSGGLPLALLVAPGGEVLLRSEGTLEVDRLRRTIDGWLRDESASRTRAERPKLREEQE
jgi:thiol-disulfide isomerase/thioredoxin